MPLSSLLGTNYKAVINVTGSGDFTAGSLIITRKGDIVTITAISAGLNHNSLSIASSAAGLIPIWARPNLEARNVFEINAAVSCRVSVDLNGILTTNYYNSSLAATARTTSGGGLTLTYAIN